MSNVSRIALHALLSRLCYSSLQKVIDTQNDCRTEHKLLQEFIKGVCNEPVLIEPETPCEDTQVLVFNHETAVYVCFRGSSSTQDFLADVDIRRYCLDKECNVAIPAGVTIHQGFFEQYRAIQEPLFTAIETMLKDRGDVSISICGHSLGGALAQIAAAHIRLHPSFKTHPISCITFGAPRVGNNKFCSWYESCIDTSLRIVHWYDPVPNLPILPFWQHVKGECIYFTDTITRVVSKDMPWFQRWWWILRYIWPWSIKYFKDHAIDVYVHIWVARYDNATPI